MLLSNFYLQNIYFAIALTLLNYSIKGANKPKILLNEYQFNIIEAIKILK